MNAGHQPNATIHESMSESGMFPESVSETVPTLDPDVSMEADRAFDEQLLAEVPYALEAWMSRQCFGLC